MSQNKNAYFQGTEEPTPKKKRYKSEPAIVVQPRFKEPLYRNYDLYDVPGVSDKPKHGPGAGWHDMHKYKSIKDFLKDKRKKLKDKYKADDSWIQDDGSHTKKKASFRIKLLAALTKTAIDFSIDEQITPIISEEDTYSSSVPFGGNLDEYLPKEDFEGKSADKLNFGRDYVEGEPISDERLIELINKYINAEEPPLMGIPNGIEPKEDLDADRTVNDMNPEYGTTNSGNTTYEDLSR